MKPKLAVIFLAGTALFGQTQDGTVTTRVAASNRNGAVRNLTAKDFKVSVDTKDRPVIAAAIPPAGKHAIVLLFDNTTINAQDQSNIEGTSRKPSVDRPVKELKNFRRVVLKPGETQAIAVSLDKSATSYYDENKREWVAQPGDFEVQVGGSSRDIRLKASFNLTAN